MTGERELRRVEWNDEALLDWLLDETPPDTTRRAELEADPEIGPRLAALEDWLAHCRAALAPELDAGQGRRARRLAHSILDRTTREDLGWRGDLRLVRAYLGERLRASAALRVIAASLLLHLLGLPLMAWVGWLRPEPSGARILVEPPRLDPFATYDEPLREVTDPGQERLDEARLAAFRARHYVQNSLRWSRWSVARESGTASRAVDTRTTADTLLRARLRVLSGEAADAVDPALRPAPDASAVHKALWCELWLDRFLVGGGRELELDAALTRLCSGIRESEPLWTSALSRAEAYGQLTTEQAAALGRARAALPADAPHAPLLLHQGEARRVAPLGDAWLNLLEVEAAGAVSSEWVRALRARETGG
ncbi:MAG: hypothetical protein CMJ84_08405 [Planctomycetes bacterium]|nr:hypothetical protein [Planctomycetota bacterium]MDP6410132.1 hypothetical protein [Planctomycetota bacterium]